MSEPASNAEGRADLARIRAAFDRRARISMALHACLDGDDDRAATVLAGLSAERLKAVEDAAVALSLHASRARKNLENGEAR